MHHNRIRKVDARTHIITTVAGGAWGYSGDGGPATEARLAGPAGVAVVPEPGGKVTIFIADYYNGHVRAVGPDGIIRDLSDEGRAVVRRAVARGVRRGGTAARLAVRRRFEPGQDRPAHHSANCAEPRAGAAARPVAGQTSGRMSEPSESPSLVRWTLSFMRPYRGRMTLVAVLLLARGRARRARSPGC